jgi:3'-phosphoadenosine 5'-phosphosulfate sulfotransferase (PAPS reductase)/FAD synthetase
MTVSPDLTSYDVIVANISGGKDSQTMLRRLWNLCMAAGVIDRLVCVFADLGADDEWAGTAELAQAHAEYYGLRFVKVQKQKDGSPVSLFQHIVAHGKWPNNENRFCTSDMKRDPIGTVITMLCNEVRSGAWSASKRSRQVRVLNCMGMRGEESPAREKLPVFEYNKRASGKGLAKHVDNWLPIHDMSTAEVWAEIKGLIESGDGPAYHWVYDAGMPRLSCRFCVLAGRKALVRAAQIDPEGAWKRAFAEDGMSHTFGRDFSMYDIIAEAEELTRQGIAAVATSWNC